MNALMLNTTENKSLVNNRPTAILIIPTGNFQKPGTKETISLTVAIQLLLMNANILELT